MDFRFERECRTPHSEVFTVLDQDAPQGRIDIHYAGSTIHCTMCISERFTQDEIQELIEYFEDDLLDAVGMSHDDLIIHVHQGREVGVFSNREYTEDEQESVS